MNSKSMMIFFTLFLLSSCEPVQDEIQLLTREEAIPANAIKMTPETDDYPPILHSVKWEAPIPVPGEINTAGAEDSPFIPINREEFYFFFTPDVKVPVDKQLLDGATGIYLAQFKNGIWEDVNRVLL